jgi:hypothetical protein
VGAPDSDGATLSILNGPTVVLLLLSALSTAVPVTELPFVETVCGPVQLLIPDPWAFALSGGGGSLQMKPTVTSWLYQGVGSASDEMIGATLSSLIVTEPLPVLPRRSVAVDVFTVASVFPDCESVAGAGPLATPEPASVADQVIET